MTTLERLEHSIRECIARLEEVGEERDHALERSADLLYRMESMTHVSPVEQVIEDRVDDGREQRKQEVLRRIDAVLKRIALIHIDDITNV